MPTREPAQPPLKPAVGATNMFGRYKLLGRIGEGGMAEVFRALMTGPEGFERELVLKRILPRLSETGDFKTMFIREAKISALLLHPNIVQIYEFGEADGAYFIAMENVQGVTLREALTTLRREQRAMPYLVAADIARQICIGLDYAHTLHGPDGRPLEIVHQDISPTNIMLAYTGTVKILDFGIARAASFAEEEAKKGLIKGKVSYLSPEQIHVRPFDARADVFALGVVFHEMLTGRRLFQAKNDIGKMRQLLAAPIAPPSAMNATIPRELDRIVMRALSIDVTQRFQSVADMASDLERTLIAARYSSRELSKLLHGLFLPDEDPVVVVDTDDHHTVAMTGSSSGTSGAGSNPTATGTTTGVRTPSLRSTSPSMSTSMSNSASHSTPGSPGTRPTQAGKRPTSPSDAVTDPLPPIPDATELLRPSDSGAERLERVVQAERGRLARKRMRGKLRIVAVIASICVGLAVAVFAGVWAWHRYSPALLAPPPPPPKPAEPVPLPNQTAPEPAARPKKPRTTHHKAAHAASPAAETPSESAAPGDQPPPSSELPQKP
jgi:eukaryotic-like serine/threonine-protein kinase